MAMKELSDHKLVPTQDNNFKSLSKEMNAFEASRKRAENLEKLYKALLNISPTSVASERAFSMGARTNADNTMRPNADRTMRPNADMSMRPNGDMSMRPNADNLILPFLVSKRTNANSLYCLYALRTPTTDGVHTH
jgi:hypothetical protein